MTNHANTSTEGRGKLWRFVFEDRPLRGAIVHLDAGWESHLGQSYPAPLDQLMGEALAAGPLLASSLKFEGQISLQGEGQGPIRLLLTQVTHDLVVRATIRHDAGGDFAKPFPQWFQDGRMVLMVEPKEGNRYQGMVPLQGQHLAACLGAYFRQSEQLPTCLRFAAASGCPAVGMLLQSLPGEDEGGAHFTQTATALSVLEESIFQNAGVESLLAGLYPNDAIRLFEPQPVTLRCRCSHARTSQLLLNLGREEVEATLKQEGGVEICCGFCGRQYRYDANDVARLFDAAATGASDRRH